MLKRDTRSASEREAVHPLSGVLLQYGFGGIGDMGLAISLALASGAMLYVVFGEIIPQSILMYKSKLPAFFIMFGILLGVLLIYAI